MHSYLYIIINNLEGKRVAYYKLFALCMTEELKPFAFSIRIIYNSNIM